MQTNPFHNAAEITFKPKFIERYSNLTDWEEFKTCSLSFLHRSIRINTLKISVKDKANNNQSIQKSLEIYTDIYQTIIDAENIWYKNKLIKNIRSPSGGCIGKITVI